MRGKNINTREHEKIFQPILTQSLSPKRRRSLAEKAPVGSRVASSRRLCLMRSLRATIPSCSSFCAAMSSGRLWMRYFCPKDWQLSSRIAVIVPNCMNPCFCFLAFAIKRLPKCSALLGLGAPFAVDDGDAIPPTGPCDGRFGFVCFVSRVGFERM